MKFKKLQGQLEKVQNEINSQTADGSNDNDQKVAKKLFKKLLLKKTKIQDKMGKYEDKFGHLVSLSTTTTTEEEEENQLFQIEDKNQNEEEEEDQENLISSDIINQVFFSYYIL